MAEAVRQWLLLPPLLMGHHGRSSTGSGVRPSVTDQCAWDLYRLGIIWHQHCDCMLDTRCMGPPTEGVHMKAHEPGLHWRSLADMLLVGQRPSGPAEVTLLLMQWCSANLSMPQSLSCLHACA